MMLLRAPGREKRNGTDMKYMMHIKAAARGRMGGAKRNTYRVIAIRPDASLYQLAQAIIKSFDFDFDHCFGFYAGPSWRKATEGYELFSDIGEESRFLGVKQTQVESVFNDIGKKMTL
ncbi:MAG: hypothetical protein QME74_03150, partial [Candidatus Edwardsbacteria bacterium]|nr:hypothetical protein [Candidatus Edwardsbacteria bacterium]